MAIGDDSVLGPLVGGGRRPTGIIDSRPISSPARPPARRTPNRSRQVISQAGGAFAGTASRETARRTAVNAPRRPQPPAARSAGAQPRTPRAGGGGGVPVSRVPTAQPRRVPRPTNVIQLPTGGARPRQSQGTARQLLAEQEERRRRIRGGGLFQAAQGLRGR